MTWAALACVGKNKIIKIKIQQPVKKPKKSKKKEHKIVKDSGNLHSSMENNTGKFKCTFLLQKLQHKSLSNYRHDFALEKFEKVKILVYHIYICPKNR